MKVTWAEDESLFSRKPKIEYQNLRCILPVFTDELRRDIHAAMQKYNEQDDTFFKPQRFFTFKGQHLWHGLKQRASFKPPRMKRQRTKAERLKAAFWILEGLSNAQSAKEAINQLACVLHEVEKKEEMEARSAISTAQMTELTFRPMRVSEPAKEIHKGQVIYASYAIQHVILLRADGAIQIQRLPVTTQTLNYPLRAMKPDVVLFEKAGSCLLKPLCFWHNGMSE